MADDSFIRLKGDHNVYQDAVNNFEGIKLFTFDVYVKEVKTPFGFDHQVLVPVASQYDFSKEALEELNLLAESISKQVNEIMDREAKRHK